MKRGFSLIELSIVLVILGLLTGGILAGRSLIHAAELRAVGTEFSRYSTAARAFRDKYFQNPGDINNATAFWGTMSNCHGVYGYTGVGTQTCNGNGDSGIGTGDNINTFNNETFLFWQHLANAGLIEGYYTGVTGDSGSWNQNTPVLGVNAPASRYTKAGWLALPMTTGGGYGAVVHSYDISNGFLIEGDYGNAFQLGSPVYNGMGGTVIAIEDAWNLDSKLDDGKPGSGSIVLMESVTQCYLLADGSTGSNSATASRTDIIYNLKSNSACTLVFRRAY